MKKKEFLKMQPLKATETICRLVEADQEQRKTVHFTYGGSKTYHVYKRYQYYRATKKDGILKLAVFSRKELAAGRETPQYEIYISKAEGEYITYEPDTGKWKTARINYLSYNLDNGYVYGNKPWISKEDGKLVNGYLETGKMEAREAVLKFQNKVTGNRLEKKHRSEIEEIDAVMNTVPDLPKDFDEWVMESAFIHERYLMYRYGDKENTAYCTHCKKIVKLKKTPLHNQEGTCPSCRTKAIQKAWNRQKAIVDEKKAGIIQKRTDGNGYILRKFICKVKLTREKDWEIDFAGCWETNRFALDEQFSIMKIYEFGPYKQTGAERWCNETNKGGYYGWYEGPSDECVLYYRNLKRLRKGTGFQYIPLEELWRNNQGCYCRATSALQKIQKNPQIEYLIKGKLFRLAWDVADRNSEEGLIDWTEKKPWKSLKISKDQMEICIKMNINARQLSVVQQATEAGMRLSAEQIQFFTEEIGPNLIMGILKYGHQEKFMKYMKQLKEDKIRIGDYIDYIEDVEKLRMPITKDILFPKNFRQIHQNIAMQRQEKEEKLVKMGISKKEKVLQEWLPELQEIYGFEDKDFQIVLPTCKEDFNREGRENHNCVGGSYFDKMITGRSCVLFLRRTEEPQKAFCTVEMEGDKVIQCRAIRNSSPPEEVNKFMKKFSKKVRERIEKKRREICIGIAG